MDSWQFRINHDSRYFNNNNSSIKMEMILTDTDGKCCKEVKQLLRTQATEFMHWMHQRSETFCTLLRNYIRDVTELYSNWQNIKNVKKVVVLHERTILTGKSFISCAACRQSTENNLVFSLANTSIVSCNLIMAVRWGNKHIDISMDRWYNTEYQL